MKSTISAIVDVMKNIEIFYSQTIPQKGRTKREESNAARCLKLCFLCFMIHPYLHGKFNLPKMLKLALLGSWLAPETFFDYNVVKGMQQKDMGTLLSKLEIYKLPSAVAPNVDELLTEALSQKSNISKLVRALAHWQTRYSEIMSPTFKKSKASEGLLNEVLLEKIKEPIIHEIYASLLGIVTPQQQEVSPITENLLEFLQVVEKLCKVERDNLKSSGGKETDDLHIIKVLYWALFLTPLCQHTMDENALYRIILAHDIVEARTGDIPLSVQYNNAAMKLEKIQREQEAIRYIRATTPAPFNNEVYNAFDAYENKESREAEFAWALDKLDANWQANLYNGGDVRYWGEYENGAIYYHLAITPKSQIEKLEEPIISELENYIIGLSQDNIRKCEIKVS